MSGTRKIEFNEDDMVAVIPTPSLNLPDIVAERCLQPKDGSPYLVFYCKPSDKYADGCPNCGSINYISHGPAQKPRVVHDINIGITRVDLVLTVPRYYCKDCGAAFRHVFESIPEGKQSTLRLREQLRRDVFTRPFSQVAMEYGFTEGTIRYIFDEYADELEANRGPIIAPEVLGIDEKHIVHAMRGIFVDIKTGRLLEMTENNKEADIVGTIMQMVDYDKNIRIVTTDMANGYRSHIQLCLPNAKLIVDKYHVYQDLYSKVSKSKKAIMEKINQQISEEPDPVKTKHLQTVRDLVVHNAYLFKFGKDKLAEKTRRIAIMADVCKTFPEFNHLRLIKEGFERIYEQGTRADAEAVYKEWVKLIPPRGSQKAAAWERQYHVSADLYAELAIFYRTTKKWYQEIFNYFDDGCQFTNAASEGTNSMIQRINAQGNGYGFKRLRAKALYWHDAGPRVTYKLSRTKVPVYGEDTSSSMGMVTGSHPLFGGRKIIGYHDASDIVWTEQPAHQPLSVLRFLQDTEFYDFETD